MYSDKEVAQWVEDAMIKQGNITRASRSQKGKLSIEIRITIKRAIRGEGREERRLGIATAVRGK